MRLSIYSIASELPLTVLFEFNKIDNTLSEMELELLTSF